MAAGGCERGCPIGNLAQEMSDLSPAMREALKDSLAGLDAGLRGVLAEADARGELPAGLDPARAAAFILDAWEGALLRMKAEKSVEPLLRFEEFIFTRVLG
jgi:TetR/AcrR family transcriptional repressor of nem operon